MEITLDTFISLAGLLLGSGGGAFFTWRYMRRKAKAEAVSAEVEATKEMQDMYQQMVQDAQSDREHYRSERNELRGIVGTLEEEMRSMKRLWTDKEIETDRKIAQLGRKVEAMRPFLCGDMLCKKRQRVQVLGNEESEYEGIDEGKKKEYERNDNG